MKEIRIEELAVLISRKKAEYGYSGSDFVQKNSGRRRTESKKALLRNIAEQAARNGRDVPFKANY